MNIKQYQVKHTKIRKYKITFNDYQKNIFKQVDVNGNKRHYLMSVMSYLIKYSNEEGLVLKSLSKLFLMYKRYHKKKNSETDSISKAYFCKLVNELVDLKLLSKENRKVFIFNNAVDKIVDKKVDKNNSTESVENTSLEEDFEDTQVSSLNNNTYYTNTDITKMITEFYKGISCREFATKKDLIEVAKSLFVLDRVNESVVQATVISKLRNSKQKIHLNGIVQYVRSVIMEKLGDYHAEFSHIYF